MSFMLREWWRRLSGTFRHRDSETDEELRFHLQMPKRTPCAGGNPCGMRVSVLEAPRRRPKPCVIKMASAGSLTSFAIAGTPFAF